MKRYLNRNDLLDIITRAPPTAIDAPRDLVANSTDIVISETESVIVNSNGGVVSKFSTNLAPYHRIYGDNDNQRALPPAASTNNDSNDLFVANNHIQCDCCPDPMVSAMSVDVDVSPIITFGELAVWQQRMISNLCLFVHLILPKWFHDAQQYIGSAEIERNEAPDWMGSTCSAYGCDVIVNKRAYERGFPCIGCGRYFCINHCDVTSLLTEVSEPSMVLSLHQTLINLFLFPWSFLHHHCGPMNIRSECSLIRRFLDALNFCVGP